MADVILAGDIGASKTDLGLFEVHAETGELVALRDAILPSAGAASLEDLLLDFLGDDADSVAIACFGIAAPVVHGVAEGVNMPWIARVDDVSKALGDCRVVLLNDLETTAVGTLVLDAGEIETIHPGRERNGHRGVIAAGTGLGQSYLFWDGTRYIPVATEGGHVDFAPRDEIEFGFLQHMQGKYGRVSYERALSGPGLFDLYTYLKDVRDEAADADVVARIAEASDPNAVIGHAGSTGKCALCEAVVDRFISLYGAQAGNLALTVSALGGIYVAGGIVTKMVDKMKSGIFLDAFLGKGRYVDFMQEIPIHIVLNARTSMLGAAHAARIEIAARSGGG